MGHLHEDFKSAPSNFRDTQRASKLTTRPVQTDDEFITTHEAAALLKFTGKHALRSLYRFLTLKGVPKHYTGRRRFLLKRAEIVDAMQPSRFVTRIERKR
jgi:hypothetical protein